MHRRRWPRRRAVVDSHPPRGGRPRAPRSPIPRTGSGAEGPSSAAIDSAEVSTPTTTRTCCSAISPDPGNDKHRACGEAQEHAGRVIPVGETVAEAGARHDEDRVSDGRRMGEQRLAWITFAKHVEGCDDPPIGELLHVLRRGLGRRSAPHRLARCRWQHRHETGEPPGNDGPTIRRPGSRRRRSRSRRRPRGGCRRSARREDRRSGPVGGRGRAHALSSRRRRSDPRRRTMIGDAPARAPSRHVTCSASRLTGRVIVEHVQSRSGCSPNCSSDARARSLSECRPRREPGRSRPRRAGNRIGRGRRRQGAPDPAASMGQLRQRWWRTARVIPAACTAGSCRTAGGVAG